jgi:hypothetical protein
MLRTLLLLGGLVALAACGGSPQTTAENAPKPIDPRIFDFTIDLGKRIGPIAADSSARSQVLALYADSARIDSIYLVEGMSGQGVVLFPDNPFHTAELYWDPEVEPVRPAFIRISGLGVADGGTAWKTTEGVTVGTSMTELEKLNGRPFEISGFGWDYGGMVTDWKGGALADRGLGISFLFLTEMQIPARYQGDRTLVSSDPGLRKLNPRVASLELYFPRPAPELSGVWRSATDPTYEIEFQGDQMIHRNEGKVTITSTIEIDPSCAATACQFGSEEPAQGWCFLEKGEFDIQCNLILNYTQDRLVYTALGSTGKPLEFKRLR